MKNEIIFEEVKKSKQIVILVPGASGNVTSKRFDFLSKFFKEKGYSFLRYNFWKNDKELEEKTLNEIYAKLNETISTIKSKGYSKIIMIGKSIGGGFLLGFDNSSVDLMILLAPAIGFSDNNNVDEIKDLKLSNIKKYFDIKINEKVLRRIKIPTLILIGDKDNVVSIDKLEEMSKLIKDSKFKIISGMDHSFDDDKSRENILNLILDFIETN